MAVVNKFNVNKQQVTLDADIIENMSANDVSYNSSLQYNENTVGNKLSELDNAINRSEQNYIKDETIGIGNKVTKHENWYYSDFIDYYGGDIIWNFGIDAGDDTTIGLCTYDENKSYINFFFANSTEGKRILSRSSPEFQNAKFIRASFHKSVKDSFIIDEDGKTWRKTDVGLIQEQEKIYTEILRINDAIGSNRIVTNEYGKDILVLKEYVDVNGNILPSTGGTLRSEFIHVKKGSTIETFTFNTNDVSVIAFFKEDKTTFVSGVSGTNKLEKFNFTPEEDGYVVFCCAGRKLDVLNKFIANISSIIEPIDMRVIDLEDAVFPKQISIGDYPIYEPIEVSDDYKCDVGYDKAYINIKQEIFLQEYYDKYAFKKYDDGYKVFKYSLGLDAANDGHEIFCYEFVPKKYSRVVLLSSGMNSCELAPIFGLAYFIKSLMEDYKNDQGLMVMRETVKFVVIPHICPSSFDNSPCKYTNANNVRINKNFNYRGSWKTVYVDPSLGGTKGAYPDSEIETRVLKSWLGNYRGANLWIDCHADLSINQPNKLIEVFWSDDATGNMVRTTFSKIKQFYIEKGYIADPDSVVMNGRKEVNTFPKTLYSYNEIGIPALMIEQWALSVVYGSDPTKQNDKYAIKNYVTMLHQYILSCL